VPAAALARLSRRAGRHPLSYSARGAFFCVRMYSELDSFRTWETRMPGIAFFANAAGASVLPNDSSYIACYPWQVTLVIAFAWSNLRWIIGILPQQTGVYVPRRLSHVSRR
jgi:hypothetical protein